VIGNSHRDRALSTLLRIHRSCRLRGLTPVPASVSNDGYDGPDIEALVQDTEKAMAGRR
jgi:hypothetical protein